MTFEYDLCIDIANSSLITKVCYSTENRIMTVYFKKYYTDSISYQDVGFNQFKFFEDCKSAGQYYLNFVKPNFKQIKTSKMARPKTKNQASTERRFIKISINVQKINKEWLQQGEKGVYLNLTLFMLPDGEVDKFGNLGMVVQDVPKVIYEKDKSVKGEILGNAAELDWESKDEGVPGAEVNNIISNKDTDYLPF